MRLKLITIIMIPPQARVLSRIIIGGYEMRCMVKDLAIIVPVYDHFRH